MHALPKAIRHYHLSNQSKTSVRFGAYKMVFVFFTFSEVLIWVMQYFERNFSSNDSDIFNVGNYRHRTCNSKHSLHEYSLFTSKLMYGKVSTFH